MSKISVINGFPGYYVSDTGCVYSRNYALGRIKKLKPLSNKGYVRVCLCVNNIKTYKSIHRLVATAFIPNPKNKLCVNHKNGIKTDNRVENLEWCSYSENEKHSYKVLNKRNPRAKRVVQIKNGLVVAEFNTIEEAKKITKCGGTHITDCCRGIRNYAGGYQWKYSE